MSLDAVDKMMEIRGSISAVAVTTCWLQARCSGYSVIYEVYVSLSLFYYCVRSLIVMSLFSVQSLLVLYNNIQKHDAIDVILCGIQFLGMEKTPKSIGLIYKSGPDI